MSSKNVIFFYLLFFVSRPRRVSLWLMIFVFYTLVSSRDAYAGVIVNRPLLLGLNSGLVGYWTFDGGDIAGTTAFDRAGANNGTLTNGPRPAIGKIGQALDFDGVNDAVLIPGSTSLDFSSGNQITISTWIFPRTLPADGIFINKIAQSYANYEFHTVNNQIEFDYENSAANVRHKFTSTNNVVTTNTWYHVAVTYTFATGSSAKLYVNGVPVAGSWTVGNGNDDSLIGTTDPLYIGSDGNIINGLIDEVRIYNRALSAEEVKRLYNMGSSLKVNKSNTVNLKNGLVGSWSFDGPDMTATVAIDRSGNNNNGTLTNGPRKVAGKIGQGLEFDGVDDYVDVADSGDKLDIIGALTYSAWIKMSSFGGSGDSPSIVAKYDATNGIATAIGLASTDGSNLDFNIFDNSNSSSVSRRYSGNLLLGTWYHVVGVYDGGTSNASVKIYLNGARVDDTDTGAGLFSSLRNVSADFTIGAVYRYNNIIPNFNFTGLIDDVRIYNRALSAEEVKRLYNMGSSLKVNKSNTVNLKNGLVGYWTFDGGDIAGTTAFDRAGTNNGTLTNGPRPAIGRIGQALEFDGVNDSVLIPGSTKLDFSSRNQITISTWIFPRTLPADGIFINKIAQSYANYEFHTVNNQIEFDYENSAANVRHKFTSTNNVVTTNTWYHVAVTYTFATGSSAKLYVNGVPVAGSWTVGNGNDDSLIGTTDPLYIGSDGNIINGLIDEVRIYNRALSAEEVKRLYQIGR